MKVRRLFVEKLNTIHSATGENEKVQLIKSIILYLFHYYAIWLPRDSVNTQVMELWSRSYGLDMFHPKLSLSQDSHKLIRNYNIIFGHHIFIYYLEYHLILYRFLQTSTKIRNLNKNLYLCLNIIIILCIFCIRLHIVYCTYNVYTLYVWMRSTYDYAKRCEFKIMISRKNQFQLPDTIERWNGKFAINFDYSGFGRAKL